jgi:hypothetical protein
VILVHNFFVELRIAGLHVLVWGQRTQPHFVTPTEDKNRVHCLFCPKNQESEKVPNLEGYSCFWCPWCRSRPKGRPVFASPRVHGSRVSFMGVVLGTLIQLAVLYGRYFGANSHFWLLFEPRVRRKYIFGAFMMDCYLGGSGPRFRAIPKKLLGGSASS